MLRRMGHGLFLLGMGTFFLMPVAAQFTRRGRVLDFAFPVFYPPAAGVETNRLKAVLFGAEAQPQLDGNMFIKGLRIENFTEMGETQVVIQAPSCYFEMATQVASSTGQLHLYRPDQTFSLRGEGFLWQQSNGFLIISNQVRTVVRKKLVQKDIIP